MCEFSGDLRDGDASDVKMTGVGSVFDIGGPNNQYFSQREFRDAWGGTNWMKRLGMDPTVFDPQKGSSDSSSVNDISTIFDQSTGGSGGRNRKAKIGSNKGMSVGKKKLTIKPKYS